MQIPWALAATLVAYHAKGVPNRLRLSGPVLAGIYLGEVTHWNDPAIRRLNPGVRLPATAITPVFRSDGSGDTYAFSDYLAKVSPAWKRTRGVSTAISFPTGAGSRGNAGVAAYLGRNDGAIGYLGISYGSRPRPRARRERGGEVPGARSREHRGGGESRQTGSRSRIRRPRRPAPTRSRRSPTRSSRRARPTALRAFLTYAVTTGQKFGPPLQFAPLPARVLAADRATIAKLG